MQGQITGRLGKNVREFYSMTFREIGNALNGFEQLEKERNDIKLYGDRKVIFHVVRALCGKKGYKREQDIFPLEIDKIIRRHKIKKMKPLEVTRIVKDGK